MQVAVVPHSNPREERECTRKGLLASYLMLPVVFFLRRRSTDSAAGRFRPFQFFSVFVAGRPEDKCFSPGLKLSALRLAVCAPPDARRSFTTRQSEEQLVARGVW